MHIVGIVVFVLLVLSVPIGTVRSRLHRGRQLLLERLQRRDAVPVAKRCLI